MNAMPTILPLRDALDLAACGGKATNLARLLASGAPVPDGVVITNAALQQDAFDIDPLVPLLSSPVIVRSSAIGEDSADASFAGQLDSIADVTTPQLLRDAIARVWASQRSDRVLAYQAARGKQLAGMGVIVQRQVQAALSGVLFTVSPNDERQMLLEYCSGMGDALVSGAVNPGRVTIDRPAATDRPAEAGLYGWADRPAEARLYRWTDRPAEAGLYRWVRLAAPDESTPAESFLLNDIQIAKLARLALDIERTFGSPQDIEWTIDGDGKLWIVQSRPITHAPRDPRTHGPKDPRTCVWSNANVNENFPQPISPLLYSIARVGYYHYFRNLGSAFGISERRLRTMEPALRQIIGVHGARMYYNLTSIHSVLRSAPFGDLLAGSFNQFVGAEETSARRLGATYRLRQAGELAVIAARTTWQYLFVTKRVQEFERTVDTYAAETHPDRLKDKPLTDLLGDFRQFIDIRCNRWKNASLADAGSMVCYGVLQRLLARAFPGRDQQALHNTLLKALPDLVSGVPPVKLWELSRMIRADRDLHALVQSAAPAEVLAALATNQRFSRFRTAFEDFLENWGFRCSSELMLTVPSFQEAPEPVIELLRAYAAMDGEAPADQVKRQEADRIRETAAVMAALGWPRRLIVGTVLRWTQRSIQLRERARLKQALLYSRLRRVSLAIGERLVASGRLERRDDVFFLSAEELELLAAGGAMFPDHVKALVALRRHAHAELSAFAPPDSMELGAGEYFRADTESAPAAGGGDAATHLTGVGACGGTTTARAAILLDVTESHKLAAGDILVTRQTDPGWGPIFPLISGLVIERGGMLSHGAIIAREFGIPSVVGVKDATRLIPHGTCVTVDGNAGVVTLGPTDPRTYGPTDRTQGPKDPRTCGPAAWSRVMVVDYLRERFRARLFVPLALVIAAAASALAGTWAGYALDAGFALLLLTQFRTWDDLADRGRDAVAHPARVLVRGATVTQVVAFCGALAVLNICVAVWRDASGIAVAVLAALDAALGAWYLARTTRTAAGEHLLLAKYPAMVVIVAGARLFDAPIQILCAAAVLYLLVCAYEAWHDPASPIARRLSVGGHS